MKKFLSVLSLLVLVPGSTILHAAAGAPGAPGASAEVELTVEEAESVVEEVAGSDVKAEEL